MNLRKISMSMKKGTVRIHKIMSKDRRIGDSTVTASPVDQMSLDIMAQIHNQGLRLKLNKDRSKRRRPII